MILRSPAAGKHPHEQQRSKLKTTVVLGQLMLLKVIMSRSEIRSWLGNTNGWL